MHWRRGRPHGRRHSGLLQLGLRSLAADHGRAARTRVVAIGVALRLPRFHVIVGKVAVADARPQDLCCTIDWQKGGERRVLAKHARGCKEGEAGSTYKRALLPRETRNSRAAPSCPRTRSGTRGYSCAESRRSSRSWPCCRSSAEQAPVPALRCRACASASVAAQETAPARSLVRDDLAAAAREAAHALLASKQRHVRRQLPTPRSPYGCSHLRSCTGAACCLLSASRCTRPRHHRTTTPLPRKRRRRSRA
jgi:hypothetical protein